MAERRVRSYTRNGKVVRGHSRKRRSYGTAAATRDTLASLGVGAVTGEVARHVLLNRDPVVRVTKERVAKKTAMVYPLVRDGLIREGKTIAEAEADARKAVKTADILGKKYVKNIKRVQMVNPFNFRMRQKIGLAAGAGALTTGLALTGYRRWRKRKRGKKS